MVHLVSSKWNDLVSDMYRIKGVLSILYPTNYIPRSNGTSINLV